MLKFQIPLPEKKEREKKCADVGCLPHLHKNVGLKEKKRRKNTISERHKEKEQLKAETLDFLLEFLNTEAPLLLDNLSLMSPEEETMPSAMVTSELSRFPCQSQI